MRFTLDGFGVETEDESYWIERDLHKEFEPFAVAREWYWPVPPIFARFGLWDD